MKQTRPPMNPKYKAHGLFVVGFVICIALAPLFLSAKEHITWIVHGELFDLLLRKMRQNLLKNIIKSRLWVEGIHRA